MRRDRARIFMRTFWGDRPQGLWSLNNATNHRGSQLKSSDGGEILSDNLATRGYLSQNVLTRSAHPEFTNDRS